MLSKERIGKITGSRIGAILGLQGAFKGRNAVLIEMVKEYYGEYKNTTNTHMQRGIELESLILQEFSKQHSLSVKEGEFLLHKDYSFLGATPDGSYYDIKGNLVSLEIKAPVEFKDISDSYFAQMQLQMEVLNADYGMFVQGILQEGKIVLKKEFIPRERGFIPKHLKALQNFMQEYEKAKENYVDLEIDILSKQYVVVSKELKSLQDKQQELRQKLISKGSFCNAYVNVCEQIKKGSIDYASYCKDNSLEIPSRYQKPESKYYTIRLNNE